MSGGAGSARASPTGRAFLDVFCGMGGFSEGLKRAGWEPVCGVDIDPRIVDAYVANHSPGNRGAAEGVCGSIEDPAVSGALRRRFAGRVGAVVGGPPCQGSSGANLHTRSMDKKKNTLPFSFIDFAASLRPRFIVMEEVPDVSSMRTADGRMVVDALVARLRKRGYAAVHGVLRAVEYGVPQSRRRYIILARRGALPAPVFPPPPTVRRPVSAGAVLREPYRGEPLSGETLKKVRLRERLGAAAMPNYFPQTYKVMDMSKPGPTLTTKFNGASNGPFTLRGSDGVHRRMTLREALLLQSFPRGYRLPLEGKPMCAGVCRTMVGNAVPPMLAWAVATCMV
jgi:DNA (cytosine-5)-methyltransferase 1